MQLDTTKTKVSIIIPVYNVEPYICDCLDSVYKQCYDNIEVVIVNDCTPDNSMEVAKPNIKKLRERFEVQIVEHKQNAGLSAARNSGIKNCTGEWIYLIDSDDEITPDCISLLVDRVIKYPSVDFVISGIQVINSPQTYPLYMPEYCDSKEDIINGYIYGKWYVMAINKLLNKEFFISNNLWFEEGLLHEDEKFTFQLAFAARFISTVQNKTYIYKVRSEGSITSQLKLKNLTDSLTINNFKFDYIKNNLAVNSPLDISPLMVNSTFASTRRVAKNKTITLSKKRELIQQQLQSYKSIRAYLKKNDTIKQKIKQLILRLPVNLLINIFSWKN